MRKEMPLVSFSVESDTQKHGKDCEETYTFFVIFLLICAAARPFSDCGCLVPASVREVSKLPRPPEDSA